MISTFVIGAVASASACAGIGIGYLVTKAHYQKHIPKRGEDGLFKKR